MYTRKHSYPIVPIYTFHSIAHYSRSIPYGQLSISPKTFSMALSYLRRRNFTTITLNDLYRYLSTGDEVPPRSIVITFDDGYLDNWVNAFPVLQKHGMKATIFVTPEFVDPTVQTRPTLLDVWKGGVRTDELTHWGFLSWIEMKAMEKSGLIDIQSHSMTHSWRFQKAEIIDFHHPGDEYPWLAWNKRPERKYLWPCENQDEFVEFGAPVYLHGMALAAPSYIPDDALVHALQEYVKKNGGREFFKSGKWRDELFSVAGDYTRRNKVKGRYERQEEYEDRVERELVQSKEVIERNLGKTVKFLAWPGGACNHTTQRIAEKVGYIATTRGSAINTWGADPRRIDRMGGRVRLTRNSAIVSRYTDLLKFVLKVESYRGNVLSSSLLRLSLRTVRAGQWFRGGDRDVRPT